jgi:SulP family sulfate permease
MGLLLAPPTHIETVVTRMFLFSTIVGQIALTFASKFTSAIGLEMVENIPFWHALAYIVTAEQGYGVEALSTLFFLFGFSSVVVGILFYALGKLQLGRVVYYFPAHVLIGCIGGIGKLAQIIMKTCERFPAFNLHSLLCCVTGVFIFISAIEVTINSSIEFTLDGFRTFFENMHLFGVVLVMEVTLRALSYLNHLNESGQPRFKLLAPLFFCLITPIFYFGLWIFGVDMTSAMEAGYFFPASDGCIASAATDCEVDASLWALIFNKDLFDMWRVFDFTSVSWRAIFNSLPTVMALSAFSLIHVPINIPAFAISIDAGRLRS